jgi:hypothetical protein
MSSKAKRPQAPATVVTVYYWQGTTQRTGTATSYEDAMELADQNQNAYGPTFFHGERALVDDGCGLAYEDELNAGRTVYAV